MNVCGLFSGLLIGFFGFIIGFDVCCWWYVWFIDVEGVEFDWVFYVDLEKFDIVFFVGDVLCFWCVDYCFGFMRVGGV